MIKYYILFLFSLLLIVSCQKDKTPVSFIDESDIRTRIDRLPGVGVKEIEPNYGYPRAFQIEIEQPLDHNNPTGMKFTQTAYLSHCDLSQPMIFAPSGYSVNANSGQEIARLLQANCLNVTHRFFEGAQPPKMEWQFLTVEQAAADHHRIVSLFKQIYSRIWISSGVSKSGQTCLFHRRFYPDDVDATLAYVTPIVFGINDMRPIEYMESLPEDDCLRKIKRFQRAVLNNRWSMIPLLENYMLQSGLYWSLDEALILELAVMDYPFAFWQYHNTPCSAIPDSNSASEILFYHLSEVVWLRYFADNWITYFEPYVYQALTETGAPGYRFDYLKDLLLEVPTDGAGNPNFELLGPLQVEMDYDPSIITDINNWLIAAGDKIIYIYGGIDPWTGAAIASVGSTNALKIIQPGEDHTVKIGDLDNAAIIYEALYQWLGLEVPQQKHPGDLPSLQELSQFRLN